MTAPSAYPTSYQPTAATLTCSIQYLLFNVAVMGFVVSAFIYSAQDGFTKIPWGLLFLTGGQAAIFVSNKALSSNAPVIFSITPTLVNAGDTITVYGRNFLPAAAATGAAAGGTAANPARLTVQVGGRQCGQVKLDDKVIRAIVPQLRYDTTPQDVTVITTSGAVAILRRGVSVLSKPTMRSISAATVKAGHWHPHRDGRMGRPRTSSSDAAVDSSIAVTPTPGATRQTAAFTFPELGLLANATKAVSVAIVQNQAVSDSRTLTVTG